MEDLLAFMIENHIVKENQIQGYSELEVSEYENLRNIKFPDAYRNYLLFMGKNHGELFEKANVFLEFIEYETTSFLWQIESYNFQVSENFKQHGFLFYAEGGYDFKFFYLDATEADPIVFWVNEENIEVDTGMRFSEFLWTKAKEMAEIIDVYSKTLEKYSSKDT